ncbi:hypothetical protein SDC9_169219 [bioreactor metagenome]|uniref:Helix-turn-helix domain-containing protein n=1 Tax=bioreactor metagenome TaxID=1076179 RepID=A0A645G4K8_9ZZZZ
MYSRAEVQTFQNVLKPLCDAGAIPQELYNVALQAVNDRLKAQVPDKPKREILITRQQAAEMLGCCTRTVDRLRKEGKLAAVQYGTASIRFRESDIISLQQGQSEEGRTA